MPAPTSPAPVSGPGTLARRTDGGPAQKLRNLPDAKYGEQATYQQDERGAPMSQTPSPSASPQIPVNPMAGAVVPFSQPTQNPTEPVTSGVPIGAGPGPEALGISPQQVVAGDADKVSKYLPVLDMVANMPDSLPGSRLMVNLIRANMGSNTDPRTQALLSSAGPQ